MNWNWMEKDFVSSKNAKGPVEGLVADLAPDLVAAPGPEAGPDHVAAPGPVAGPGLRTGPSPVLGPEVVQNQLTERTKRVEPIKEGLVLGPEVVQNQLTERTKKGGAD